MAISSQTLGEFTADGAVFAGRTRLYAVAIITDGTNPADVILYDNATAASGTKVYEGGVAGADRGATVVFDCPVKCDNGLYLDITGTGASCIVYTV